MKKSPVSKKPCTTSTKSQKTEKRSKNNSNSKPTPSSSSSSTNIANTCPWASTYSGANTPAYQKYHDEEWGRPTWSDDRHLFEMLVLEHNQAGLSWATILNKREQFRKVFFNFDVEKVCGMGKIDTKSGNISVKPEILKKLLKNEGIIRNEAKINAAVNNAFKFREIQKKHGSFANFFWSFFPNNKPIQNSFEKMKQLPAKTEISDEITKSLKKLGFKFLGSTTIYAYMQSCGFVNDHLVSCRFYEEIRKIGERGNGIDLISTGKKTKLECKKSVNGVKKSDGKKKK